MGNRAVISDKRKQIGIYLHWNGGPESICAFLTYAKLKEVRSVDGDPAYFYSRLSQIICNFFGGTTSCGVDVYEHLDTDNWDNGTYLVDENFNVEKRLFADGCSVARVTKDALFDFLLEIDRKQPEQILSQDEKSICCTDAICKNNIEFAKVPGLEIVDKSLVD